MIDEIAVPDRLEQAVAEPKGEDVLRRLLAEEVIDAEDLLLGEHLVQRVVERDRAFEIGAERLFHNDARSARELGLAQHLDRRQRGVRRHAHVVDALGLLGEGLLRPVDRLLESAGAGRDRHVVEQSLRRPARPPSWGRWACCSKTASRARARKPSASSASSDTPMIRHFEMKPARHQVKEAGQQLLVGEISGRAKQDDDLRQLGADPDRYSRHCVLRPRPCIPRPTARQSLAFGRQKRDKPEMSDRPTISTAAT